MSRKFTDVVEGPPGVDPTLPDHLARKGYVDLRLLKSGDTMSGPLTITGAGKGYRFRQTGSLLDLEGAGTSLVFSMWTVGDFTGVQNNVFTADTDGTLNINKALVLPAPTAPSHAVRNDDARLSDARTPVTHTHSATDINSGQLSNSRLPIVLSNVRTALSPAAGGSVDVDASLVSGGGNNLEITPLGDYTQNVPTNGGNGQVLQFSCYSASAYTITFNAGLGRLGTIAATLPVTAGKVARYAIRRTNVSGSTRWIVEAASTEQ